MKSRLAWHVSQGANQYAPMTGVTPLHEAIADREIYVLSDEVYEHICFADGGHQSVLAHDGLCQRAIAVSSFGKTYI